MREVMQGDASNPKVTMGNNYRPVMQIYQRTVRTNINFNNPVSTPCPNMTFISKTLYKATSSALSAVQSKLINTHGALSVSSNDSPFQFNIQYVKLSKLLQWTSNPLSSLHRCFVVTSHYCNSSFYAPQHTCRSAYMPSPVRPSVTRVDQSKTAEVRMTQFSP